MMQYDGKDNKTRVAKTQITLVETLLAIADKNPWTKALRSSRKKFENFREIKEMPLPAQFTQAFYANTTESRL